MPPVDPSVRAGILAAATVGLIVWAPIVLTSRSAVDVLQPGRRTNGAAVLERDFGADRITRAVAYDGQSVYLIARLLPDLDAIGQVHRDPRYRAQRILLPALASPLPPGMPTLVALQVWSLLGVGLAGWALAELAVDQGLPALTGAVAALPLAIPQWLTTTEALATGLLLAGVVALRRDRLLPATALLAAAGLTRESYLLAALALAAVLAFRSRWRDAAVLAAGSIAPAFLWWALLVAEMGTKESTTSALTGLLSYADVRTESVVAAVVALATCTLATVWWRRRDGLVAAVAAAFLVSTLVFGSVNPEAILRVPAPAICLSLVAIVGIVAASGPPTRREVAA